VTNEKIIEVAQLYRKLLKGEPVRGPVELDWSLWTDEQQHNHLIYVCDGIIGFVRDNRIDKAFRWLGWIQGVLAATGVFTVDQTSRHNRPNPDPDGGEPADD
jgi:hypothetical protein